LNAVKNWKGTVKVGTCADLRMCPGAGAQSPEHVWWDLSGATQMNCDVFKINFDFEHVRKFQAHCDILCVFFCKKIGQEYPAFRQEFPAFRQEFPRIIKKTRLTNSNILGTIFGEIVGM